MVTKLLYGCNHYNIEVLTLWQYHDTLGRSQEHYVSPLSNDKGSLYPTNTHGRPVLYDSWRTAYKVGSESIQP